MSALWGNTLISQDTLNIDLTSCRNDPLVLVKDHCLSGVALMHSERRIVMETIITGPAFTALEVIFERRRGLGGLCVTRTAHWDWWEHMINTDTIVSPSSLLLPSWCGCCSMLTIHVFLGNAVSIPDKRLHVVINLITVLNNKHDGVRVNVAQKKCKHSTQPQHYTQLSYNECLILSQFWNHLARIGLSTVRWIYAINSPYGCLCRAEVSDSKYYWRADSPSPRCAV